MTQLSKLTALLERMSPRPWKRKPIKEFYTLPAYGERPPETRSSENHNWNGIEGMEVIKNYAQETGHTISPESFHIALPDALGITALVNLAPALLKVCEASRNFNEVLHEYYIEGGWSRLNVAIYSDRLAEALAALDAAIIREVGSGLAQN